MVSFSFNRSLETEFRSILGKKLIVNIQYEVMAINISIDKKCEHLFNYLLETFFFKCTRFKASKIQEIYFLLTYSMKLPHSWWNLLLMGDWNKWGDRLTKWNDPDLVLRNAHMYKLLFLNRPRWSVSWHWLTTEVWLSCLFCLILK